VSHADVRRWCHAGVRALRRGGATESGEGEKVTVLMESGARFHSTSYTRERKSDAPSKFNMKLRQHLRSKRLNAVTQYGSDRAVDFTFSAGDGEHHLILELYAQGNLVLTDKDYKVPARRPHPPAPPRPRALRPATYALNAKP